ncbi:MAG: hypothetical protein TH68_06090, partial [Candidatus Synechococcus spongiarum 142]
KLTAKPEADVTVTVGGMGKGVSIDTNSRMQGKQTSLSFTTTDWNIAQVVVVSAAADENASFETVTLSHTATGRVYGSVSRDLTVTVIDDDNICGRFNGLSLDGTVCNLSSQGIESLGSDDFVGLSNLEQLDLRNNNLSSLPADVFTGLSNLQEIYLSGNDLTCLPVIPPSVKKIDVDLLRCYSLELSPSAVTLVEGGASTYTVKLASEPSAAVTVTVSGMESDVSVDTDGGMQAEQTSLTFTTTDWNAAQPVTVTAAEDDNNSSEAVTLTHTATSSGNTYSVSQELVVTVIDNETPGLVLALGAVTVAEASSATYTVRLAKEPTDGVTVTVSGMENSVSVDADGGMQGEQTTLSFTTSNWQAEQTVT